jgi:hypothetical protein
MIGRAQSEQNWSIERVGHGVEVASGNALNRAERRAGPESNHIL